MDASKILLVICAFTLIVCLTLCITALAVLRNAVAENSVLQSEASVLVEQLDGFVERIEGVSESGGDGSIEVGGKEPSLSASGFCLRETNGKIGVYTADGYLVKLLEVSVSTLPKAARDALKEGICAASWEELLALIADYTA